MNIPSSLSLVIPLYNEEQRFIEGFEVCMQYYKKYPDWEFIFVNDGSLDRTGEIVKQKIKDLQRMHLVEYRCNRGKGYAIRRGVDAAGKQLILFSDIDFSTPLTELEIMYPFMTKGADIVIGTRKVQGAQIKLHQKGVREWMGKQFTALTNKWLGLDMSDYTCGFKLFRSSVAKKIFSKQQVLRWGFDAEVLFLAHLYGFNVVEVPIIWQNDERTKVSMVKDSIRSLRDLWVIRWSHIQGRYSLKDTVSPKHKKSEQQGFQNATLEAEITQ